VEVEAKFIGEAEAAQRLVAVRKMPTEAKIRQLTSKAKEIEATIETANHAGRLRSGYGGQAIAGTNGP
jgi:hypothetical protein